MGSRQPFSWPMSEMKASSNISCCCNAKDYIVVVMKTSGLIYGNFSWSGRSCILSEYNIH
jgi:hypothetical protein